MTNYLQREYEHKIREMREARRQISENARPEMALLDMMVGWFGYTAQEHVKPDGRYTGSIDHLILLNAFAQQRKCKEREAMGRNKRDR